MNDLIKNGELKDFHGFEWRAFELDGREADVIFPKDPDPKKRWIWRAEFLNCSFDTVDVEMLNRGYYLVYYRVSDMYGCPESISLMKNFYDFVRAELGLDEKTILFGFSRGGLYSVNFALRYPAIVRALYLDAPVLDIKSWPGGLGIGLGSEREWNECLEIFGLDRSSVLTFRGNPVDRLEELADDGIPVVTVAGDSDRDVPHVENCEHLHRVYAERGLKELYIVKPGCDHHPHSLDDPTPVCDFLCDC
ncbi:MAG: alpha/beta hydrolase [Clostridia bacterium]|nr:alpha/beta hydrolase [Clostridia bacterium]